MKKLFCSVILLVFSFCCFAVNNQKLYDASSYEYRMVNQICTLTGVLGPSNVLPVTGEDLLLALDRVDGRKLPQQMQEKYQDLVDKLGKNEDKFDMNLGAEISPQVFGTLDYNNINRSDFFIPYEEEIPSINLFGSFSFGKNVFLEGSLSAINSPTKGGLLATSFGWLVNHKNGNWNFLGQNQTSLLNTIPLVARGSIGNKWVNFTFGRTPHSMGAGITSNMTIADNFLYQELMKLSFNSKYFVYNMSVTRFDAQNDLLTFDIPTFGGNIQNRVVHRFDVNVIDKIRFSLNLSTLYFANNAFDLRWFNPFIIAHNYYNYNQDVVLKAGDEANNLFGFEIEAIVAPQFKISGQFVLDQLQTVFEDLDALPAACGGLLNFEWTTALNNDVLKVWTEAVYTTDMLYLNTKYDDEEKQKPNYNYDYILGYHTRLDSENIIGYSGYKYGPGCIALSIGSSYENYDHNFSIDGYFMYKNQSNKGFESPNFAPASEVKENMYQLRADAKWNVLETLELFTEISLRWYSNYKNNQGVNKFIPETRIGFTWTACEI